MPEPSASPPLRSRASTLEQHQVKTLQAAAGSSGGALQGVGSGRLSPKGRLAKEALAMAAMMRSARADSSRRRLHGAPFTPVQSSPDAPILRDRCGRFRFFPSRGHPLSVILMPLMPDRAGLG